MAMKVRELSALVTLASGIALSFFSFFHSGDVATNVLFYFGQCLLYAGGIFAIKQYVSDEIARRTRPPSD